MLSDLDYRIFPLFPDCFLEVQDDMCHNPGFCGNSNRIGFQKLGGIDDAGTGEFFNGYLIDAFYRQEFFFSPFNLLF